MGYAEHRVAPGVEVWCTSGGTGTQRILPDGCLDLILDGDRLLVAGPDSVARVHAGAAHPMHAVRLHGGRAATLLRVPADVLADRTVPLADLWGDAAARRLTDRLASDPAAELARWAVHGEVRRSDGFGVRLVELLRAGASVTSAADALGYSTRQLQRRARPLFGYGPQHLARVLRLQRAVALADARTGWTGWADVAARAGYADQAHLARDVRALAGTTPTALRAERVRSVQDAA